MRYARYYLLELVAAVVQVIPAGRHAELLVLDHEQDTESVEMNTLHTLQPISRPITIDAMFSGAVICRQFQDGYRFSVDAVLAGHYHRPAQNETILDLGAGCGIISLILMYRWANRIQHLQALEYQPQLCSLLHENFQANGFEHTCSALQGDVKRILDAVRPESFSLVVCNPPYYPAGSGRKSGTDECSLARHLIAADLDDFTRAAAVAVKNGGTVVFIYPADFFTSLCQSLAQVRLEIKQLQWIYSYPDKTGKAQLVLIKAVKNGGRGCAVNAPFYIYAEPKGAFSHEMQALYEPWSNRSDNVFSD